MSKKSKPTKKSAPQILNRRARFDYQLGEEVVAGLILTGPEVRAAREGHVQLKGAFVSLRGGELWLNNTSFSLKINQRGLASARTVDTSPSPFESSTDGSRRSPSTGRGLGRNNIRSGPPGHVYLSIKPKLTCHCSCSYNARSAHISIVTGRISYFKHSLSFSHSMFERSG